MSDVTEPIDPYEIALAPPARRAITSKLPSDVAPAAVEFITGPLIGRFQIADRRRASAEARPLSAAVSSCRSIASVAIPLTRDALAARLRAAGYPVRNATLTPLLAALRAEPAPVT